METRNRRIHILLAIVVVLAASGIIMNLDTTIMVGRDGHYAQIHMPLYAKWTQFMARHYEYERLARQITAGSNTDEEKVLAILKWTRENLKDVPPGMPIYDDHILYTIIRGYALPEQFQDVFTNLCAYSRIPAFYGKPYDKSRTAKYAVSFVELNGKWRVFDAYRGIYFRNKSGEIAGIDDIEKDPSIVSGKNVESLTVYDIPYRDFFYNLSGIAKPVIARPQRQMPLSRMIYEARRALGCGKEDD